MNEPRLPQSFRRWSDTQPLGVLLSRAEAGVRSQPQDAQARWLLFELLCVLGQWERGLRQLQVWATLSREHEGTAHVMRGLLRAEVQRAQVLAGLEAPALLLSSASQAAPWMKQQAEALEVGAQDDLLARETSDMLRDAALAQAPDVQGVVDGRAFDWVTDSDTRIGPVCELIASGAYRWVAFADVARIDKTEPARLLDLVWAQVDVLLSDRTPIKAYMPMRYPVLANDRDALLLGRETIWDETSRTCISARGQKVWATDSGDVSLLDLRHCEFDRGSANGAA
ncbi:type VI secretion system accessory protein TagJ [Variovorax sp. OV329]|uniref:type VI secretion system accessory protein TagJ n=1 Tax=Variovorax sp. OV329 TaxID=1882825 RepID=UPI0008EE6B21|nr:type VI secretion system accessory protein TagJ [Variovorax sp. OV329]SFN36104.1 type VI secretion system protein ImpE [Variovorax sp. OV329]